MAIKNPAGRVARLPFLRKPRPRSERMNRWPRRTHLGTFAVLRPRRAHTPEIVRHHARLQLQHVSELRPPRRRDRRLLTRIARRPGLLGRSQQGLGRRDEPAIGRAPPFRIAQRLEFPRRTRLLIEPLDPRKPLGHPRTFRPRIGRRGSRRLRLNGRGRTKNRGTAKPGNEPHQPTPSQSINVPPAAGRQLHGRNSVKNSRPASYPIVPSPHAPLLTRHLARLARQSAAGQALPRIGRSSHFTISGIPVLAIRRVVIVVQSA